MSRYAVDLELLDQLIGRLLTFESQLTEVRDSVDARMNRVRAVWTGVAADEHAHAHTLWATGAQEMAEALQRLHAIASTAQENYRAALAANSQMWAQ